MRGFRSLVVAAGVALAGTSASADESKRDELCRTFVTEFLAVTPGEGTFPKTFLFGPMSTAKETAAPPAFRMNKYEVPQNLYEAVMGQNPSRWKGPRNSAEMMSFPEAEAFCAKVTGQLREQKLIGADEVVRLPSELEWEYVCRAGTTTAYSFGDDAAKLTEFGWFHGNAAGNDPPVGAKKPNPWGFYDVHGYLWEFCSDSVGERNQCIVRGGAWTAEADECASHSRLEVAKEIRRADIGFRCVLAKTPEKAK